MARGVTCYERDETRCEDPECFSGGCRIIRLRLAGSLMEGMTPENTSRSWQPIDTAPIPAATKINPRTYLFRCLIQNKLGDVFEGEAHYVKVSRSSVHWVLHWYIARGRKLCKPLPIYWMPMPAPRMEEPSEQS